MEPKKAIRHLFLAFVIALSWGVGYVQAQQSTYTEIWNNLNKTRDSLLDQRTHLQERADRINEQIAELQRQLDIVNNYLRDTDRNIRDVEDALRRVR